MKEKMKCIVRAINLSVPNKPKQIQKLVSAELVEPCPHFEHGSSSYWTPKPVHIKICTRKDMERICPPKINIPRLENARYSLVQKYNRAVFRIMNVLVEIPQKVHRKLSTILFRQEKTSEETIENDYTDKG
ncbi:uncharacterized protein LOC122521923 [Polistes fuscatus]|uniref:uncharacterized protein LOC122521923 n=1 Tax=Polistes fuscatus TaxID=30207 RepID=UPI001CA8BC31|nr:uncharacterized protein LOC122521923 [Polistes fuscatus]